MAVIQPIDDSITNNKKAACRISLNEVRAFKIPRLSGENRHHTLNTNISDQSLDCCRVGSISDLNKPKSHRPPDALLVLWKSTRWRILGRKEKDALYPNIFCSFRHIRRQVLCEISWRRYNKSESESRDRLSALTTMKTWIKPITKLLGLKLRFQCNSKLTYSLKLLFCVTFELTGAAEGHGPWTSHRTFVIL